MRSVILRLWSFRLKQALKDKDGMQKWSFTLSIWPTETQIPNCPNFHSGVSSAFLIKISNKITGSVLAPWCVITKYESFSGSINQINCESCGSDVQWGFGPQTRISVSSDFRAEVLPLCLGDTLSATTDWVLHLFSLICGLMSLERHKKHMRKSPTQDSTLIPHKKLRAPKLNPALRHWESSSSESGGVALIVQADIYLMGGRYRGAGVGAYTHGLARKHKHTQGLQSVPVWFQSPSYLCLFSFRSVSHPLWQPLLSPGGYTVLSSCSTIWFCSALSYPTPQKS